MPPKKSHKKLESGEIELLTRWIEGGAEFSEAWAYVPPKKNPLPQVNNAAWAANWIDHFVLAKLEANELTPSPDADRVTLIRRLSFDLTGLPPTPEEVDAFAQAGGRL